MSWKNLYVGAIRSPEALQSLLSDGLAAAEASSDSALLARVRETPPTPFKLCATLDEHGVPAPGDADSDPRE